MLGNGWMACRAARASANMLTALSTMASGRRGSGKRFTCCCALEQRWEAQLKGIRVSRRSRSAAAAVMCMQACSTCALPLPFTQCMRTKLQQLACAHGMSPLCPAPMLVTCRHGRGKFSAGAYKYEGEWRNDKQHGSGACQTDAGDKYVGGCCCGGMVYLVGTLQLEACCRSCMGATVFIRS